MSKGKRAKVWFETTCKKHGRKNRDTGDYVVAGDPANHDRGLKESGCPVCKSKGKDDG